MSTWEGLSPAVLKEDFTNGSYRLYGRDIEIMNALANEMNFLNLKLFMLLPSEAGEYFMKMELLLRA